MLRAVTVALLSLSAFLLSACSSLHQEAVRPLDSLLQIKLGMPESRLSASTKLVFFDANGHFGNKVQYDSKEAGPGGASYALHCRGGKCFGAEIKYPDSGTDRDEALKAMRSILPESDLKVSEHDDQDLSDPGPAKGRCEFFYFGNICHAEMVYGPGARPRVLQVNVWSD